MMKKQIIYFFTLVSMTLLILSCKKDEIPDVPTENNPIFNVEGTIGNETIDLHAGKNEALMLPKVEILNGIQQFSGRLSDGTTSATLNIFGTNVDIQNLSGNFIELPSYTISEQYGTYPLLKIDKEDFHNSSSINYLTWTVDGIQQNSATLKIVEPGRYDICVNAFFQTGEVATTCNSVFVGYHDNADFILHWNIIQNYTINATIEAYESSVESVKWYIDGLYITDSIELNQNNIPNKFLLKAEVVFQNGVVKEREIFINKLNVENNIQDFVRLGQKSTIRWDSTALFTIEINGVTYHSINGPTNNSSFNVTNISDYKSNEDGTKVKLIKGSIDSPFLNTSTGDVVSGSFQIEIGVGY